MPAYTVFTDASLRDLCEKRPATDEEFLAVSGVGQAKLKKYGPAFLRAIHDHKEESGQPPGDAQA